VTAANPDIARLLDLMRQLRDPQHGCPWDREQDFTSIAPYTIEEAYEVADAIDRGEAGKLRDELGDLLFQVVFHARMAEERGWFDFAAVARAISEKLVRRHPHVFGGQRAGDAATLAGDWDSHKSQERAATGATATLADIPLALPGLLRAAKLGRRAARVGFDWPDIAGVRDKVQEELAESDAAIAVGDHAATSAEIGDLLFAVANWARHLDVNPEESLRTACRRFERRFAMMERVAGERGVPLSDLDAVTWNAMWDEAKAEERRGETQPRTSADAVRAGFRTGSDAQG
jgi:MazG family protein